MWREIIKSMYMYKSLPKYLAGLLAAEVLDKKGKNLPLIMN